MSEITNKKLLLTAISRLIFGIGILGLLLFLCAGDIWYWNAWIYIGTLALAIFCFGAYLFIKDKELLQKRLSAKEKEKKQNIYNATAGLSMLAVFSLSGLDYRFCWSEVPFTAVIAALVFMLLGYGLFVITLIYNRYASRIIEVQDNQKVIDTGVYAFVRHPLYTAAFIMFSASPIVLGSFYAAIPLVLYLAGILFRIKDEEKILREGLEGYTAYCKKVRYRLVPFIW